jgi:outer membrane protein TolC
LFRRLACASVGCIVLVSASSARADGPLTLDEAVRTALASNERALKASYRVEAADGQLGRARSAFLPTLVASGNGTLHATADRSGRHLSSGGSLTLNVPILNLSSFPLYAQARHQLESERWGAAQDKRQVAFDTAHAFFVVLTSERLLATAKDRLERAKASQKTAEARAEAGLASTNDITLAHVDTAGAERQVAETQGSVTRAYLELGYLIGRPVTGPLASPERTTRAAAQSGFRPEDIVKFAEAHRPDLRSSEERTAALREGAKEPLYRAAPTLSASGTLRTTIDPVPPDQALDETAQLTLSWTLYDGSARYADRRTRLAQAHSQALDERALRRSIATDIAVALAALDTARKSYELSDVAVQAAQQNTRETEILYQQGLARAIEVVDANGRRYDAEVNRETAKLAMQQAYLDLRDAMGLDPTGAEAENAAPSGGGSR